MIAVVRRQSHLANLPYAVFGEGLSATGRDRKPADLVLIRSHGLFPWLFSFPVLRSPVNIET